MTKFVELNSKHFVNADRIAEVRFRRGKCWVNGATWKRP